MKTLVLCIDRDDDLGRKAGITSPIIGKEKNLDGAEKLAMADPEESDVNCIFSAISTYNDLIREGDAEIATICGDINVGPRSDQIIARQLEEILKEVNPDNVILVSDGAEDEYVLPIVESRIKVDAIKRVVVKQSRSLEGTYYLFAKFLEDEKMQRKFVLPISLILVIWGMFALAGASNMGFAAILFTLGIYLLIRVFHLEEPIASIGREVSAGLKSGKISLFANLLSLLIVMGAVIGAYNHVVSSDLEDQAEYVIIFIGDVLWWIVVAILISGAGKFADVYVREGKILWGYFILPFSLLAFALILSAALEFLEKVIQRGSLTDAINTLFFIKVVVGIMIAFIGMVSHRHLEEFFGSAATE